MLVPSTNELGKLSVCQWHKHIVSLTQHVLHEDR